MNSPRTIIAAGLAASALLGASPALSHAAPTTKCQEDAPCFVWSTMGNHKRSVFVGTRRYVVGPCQYSRMGRSGAINWDRTPLLKGDITALYNGCK